MFNKLHEMNRNKKSRLNFGLQVIQEESQCCGNASSAADPTTVEPVNVVVENRESKMFFWINDVLKEDELEIFLYYNPKTKDEHVRFSVSIVSYDSSSFLIKVDKHHCNCKWCDSLFCTILKDFTSDQSQMISSAKENKSLDIDVLKGLLEKVFSNAAYNKLSRKTLVFYDLEDSKEFKEMLGKCTTAEYLRSPNAESFKDKVYGCCPLCLRNAESKPYDVSKLRDI